MTLSEFASHITTKLRKSDAASLAACKQFLAVRHQLIWDSFLWRDSLVSFFDLPVPVDEEGDYRSEVVLPYAIHSPILVWDRNNEALMVPGTLVDFARMDSDAALKSGLFAGFVELPATGIAVPTTGATLGIRFLADLADSGGSVHIQYGGELDDVLWGTIPHGDNTDGSMDVSLASGSYTSVGRKIARMSKSVTASRVQVTVKDADTGIESSWYWPAQSTISEFARIRLVQRPEGTDNLKIGVLGKRKPRAFSSDGDTPCLRRIDNALIALATGDMLERDRQYNKAAAKFAEGAALIETAKQAEMNQGAHVAQVVPECPMTVGGMDDFGW